MSTVRNLQRVITTGNLTDTERAILIAMTSRDLTGAEEPVIEWEGTDLTAPTIARLEQRGLISKVSTTYRVHLDRLGGLR